MAGEVKQSQGVTSSPENRSVRSAYPQGNAFTAVGIDRVIRAARSEALIDAAAATPPSAARAFDRRKDLPVELRELFVTAYEERTREIASDETPAPALTADTITDEQIRELRRAVLADATPFEAKSDREATSILDACDAALRLYGPDRSGKRSAARARCAEILNARAKEADHLPIEFRR